MKKLILLLFMVQLASCADNDSPDPVLVELNRSLSGEWTGISFLRNQNEEFITEIDSFSMDFEVIESSIRGSLEIEIDRNLYPNYSSTQVVGYSLIDGSSMYVGLFDSVRFSIQEGVLTYDYVNGYGDNIEILAVRRE